MGSLGRILGKVTLHALGLWALAYLYGDLHERGLVGSVLGTSAANGHGVVADIIPKSILALQVGFLFGRVELAVAGAYVLYILAVVYRWIFTPMDSVHHYKTRDMGHQIPPGKNEQEANNYVQQLRKVGNIPPPYPNGWYEVMRSCDLPLKAVRSVAMLGENFAVFRGEDGKVSIVDAYCPHLGANLGAGGRVHGNCIECPFHGWQFDGETGQCVKIPYSEQTIPKSAKTKVWPSTECHNLIFLWYDAEGRDPLFPLEEIAELKNGQFKFRGRNVHYIATHIEEISENGADMMHLGVVHGPNVTAGASRGYNEGWMSRLLTHHWKGNWEPKTESQSHMGCMTIHLTHTILGVKVPLLNVSVVTYQIGPSLVILRYKTAFGCGVWVETIVPEGPLYQRMTNYAYTDWWVPSFIASSFLEGMGTQIDRDVNIWVNKTYHLKPLYVKEDRILVEHRRWFSQFYTENSKKFTLRREKDLTW